SSCWKTARCASMGVTTSWCRAMVSMPCCGGCRRASAHRPSTATAPESRRSERFVDKTGPGQAQRESVAPPSTTAAYYLSFIVLGLVLAVLGPTLPYLADQTGSQLSQVSILFAARSLGGFSGALLAGRVYDRRAGHPIVMATLV